MKKIIFTSIITSFFVMCIAYNMNLGLKNETAQVTYSLKQIEALAGDEHKIIIKGEGGASGGWIYTGYQFETKNVMVEIGGKMTFEKRDACVFVGGQLICSFTL